MTRPGRLLAGLAAVPLALAVSATSDGSEETWIDPDPEAEGPAPGITLIAAGGDAHGGSTASPASSTVDDGEQAAPVTAAADDEGTDPLAIASLVVAAAALVVAGFAAWSTRRPGPSKPRRSRPAYDAATVEGGMAMGDADAGAGGGGHEHRAGAGDVVHLAAGEAHEANALWHAPLRRVLAAELTRSTAQTSGMDRREAISGKTVGSQKLWMGETHVAPATNSGDHHHGEAETAIYVVSGNPRFVFAEGEQEVVLETGPGDYVFVPPYTPHREENPSPDTPAVVVIARSTQEGIVVNLPSLWATSPQA